ncbi:MAG TPA: hypothetical protein VGH02_00155 [Rhizomicrobium sp.]|jgi:hypothetical protein
MFLNTYKILGHKEYSPQVFSKTQNEGQKLGINLRADSKPPQRLKRKPPKLMRKNKGGAPKGNRNARKDGFYGAEMLAMRRTVRDAIVKAKRALAMAKLECAQKDAKAAAMRLAARQVSARPPALRLQASG